MNTSESCLEETLADLSSLQSALQTSVGAAAARTKKPTPKSRRAAAAQAAAAAATATAAPIATPAVAAAAAPAVERPSLRGIESSLEIPIALKEHWFPAEFSGRLLPDMMIPLELFGEAWVMFRDPEGKAACIKDECAHRACPLSVGSVKDGVIACPYHGWEYDGHGTCTKMPSTQMCQGVRVRALPIQEADGLIWVWPGSEEPAPSLPTCAAPPAGFTVHAELMMEVGIPDIAGPQGNLG